MSVHHKSVLIYGGCGQMGQVVVKKFKDHAWKTVSIDLRESDVADHSVVIKGDGGKDDAHHVISKLKEWKVELDAVISVAGGFTMGSIKDENIFQQTERMISFNLRSALSAAHVASHCLKESGLVVLTGAYGALQPTPAFLAYGVAKSGTHHLIQSLAQENSGMPKQACIVGLLPVMLDTAQNRKDMPSANFDDWTKLDELAEQLVHWSVGNGRPHNGEMIQVKTSNKKTTWTPVKPVHLA